MPTHSPTASTRAAPTETPMANLLELLYLMVSLELLLPDVMEEDSEVVASGRIHL